MTDGPICADCGRDMRIVEVRHRTGMRSHTPICPHCLTSRPRRQKPQIATPHLHVVRNSA